MSIDIPIRIWLRDAAEQLASLGIASALLDAEIILAHTLRKSRTWLHAHNDELLSPRQMDIANARLLLRLDRVPIAYIIGHKEFYGRLFKVTPSTLIPRPESEEIITLAKKHLHQGTIADIGTGSGCLGITLKLEIPNSRVILTDISRFALTVAKENAAALHADVTFHQGSLLDGIATPLSAIVANLPYVDREWEVSPETVHEPSEALFAEEGGLRLIFELIDQAKSKLLPGGILILEADDRQHEAIIRRGHEKGFDLLEASGLIVVLQRASSL